MWYVYILKLADGEYYVGSTNDLKRRLEEHKKGHEISTKWRLPVVLQAYIAVKSESTARKLEKYLKTSSGKTTLRKRILPDDLSCVAKRSRKR
jgi:putative endonuclease